MKRKKIILSLATLLIVKGLSGASIDHIMNYTPEYNANPALQGVINQSSTVNYNPAGLTKVEDGTYINAGLQLAIGTQGMKYDGKDYSADHVSPIPNFSIYKKEGRRAYFWTLGGVAGGAELEYKNGIAAYKQLGNNLLGYSNKNSKAKGSNLYIQTTIGTAFEITDKLSMSVATRGVYGQRNFSGEIHIEGGYGNGQIAKIDAEREAFGFGGQIGLNYMASDKLNIGLRYDSKVRLKFETKADETKLNIPVPILHSFGFSDLYEEYEDGAKIYRDLPAILAMGIQYKTTDLWTLYTGLNYYFNKSANLDEKAVKTSDLSKREYKDGWEISLGSEYQVSNKLAWLAGVNYAKTGASANNYRDSEYAIDSWMFGTGVKYQFSDTLELTATVTHYLYDSSKSENNLVEYHKSITTTGLGFSKRI